MSDLRDCIKKSPTSIEANLAIEELIAALGSDWRFARVQACGALTELGPLAAPALPDLIHAAKCGDGFVEQEAIHVLASMGPDAAPAVDLLLDIVRSLPPDHDPVLTEMYAISGLGNIGEAAKKAIPVLERALQSTSEKQVRLAKDALQKLNPTGYYEPLIELR